jgi:DNA (cytosine-5)-methyltransferase 1
MMGRADFEEDERHFLYLEYLKIIADHAPPVFVMENVKGLLSAKVGGAAVIDRIIADLAHPGAALRGARSGLRYRLYSLTEQEMPGERIDPRLFLVHAEKYGVPQARHRMFIVGIRDDIAVHPGLLRPHKAPTVRETIGTLPAIRSGLSRGADNFERWTREIGCLSSTDIERQLNGARYTKAVASGISLELSSRDGVPTCRSSRAYPGRIPGRFRALSSLHDTRLKTLTGHESRSHMASDLRRYMYAAVFAQVTGHSHT